MKYGFLSILLTSHCGVFIMRSSLSNSTLFSCSASSSDPGLRSEYLYAHDEKWVLKMKGEEVSLYLNGCSLFLVGMMGCGKTTVGNILAEALAYTFVDSDKYVEHTVGGVSVAHIFQKHGENFFRDFESEALQKLCLVPQQVVATGGGAVVRPVNREYMRQGISVFLDVPLEILAKRIVAEGTDSRPMLDFDSGTVTGDSYTKAFRRLSTLLENRREAYSDADVTISISDLADILGVEDASYLKPADIAFEVLLQLCNYLQAKNNSIPTFP